jgi:hypothetical protein
VFFPYPSNNPSSIENAVTGETIPICPTPHNTYLSNPF